MVDNRNPVPGADIDIRIALADAAYERLWAGDKTAILAGLGNILRLIDRDWIRAVTQAGVIVELAVFKTSAVDGLALHDWKILFSRLPAGQPAFIKLPALSPAEHWRETQDCTPAFVWRQTEMIMTALANCPAPFYNNELDSAKFTLDESRVTLIKLMYRDVGVYFAKRYKHFSTLLTPECLHDLRSTYLRPGAEPVDPAALAEATLQTYAMLGKYLARLSQRYGGGFEPTWYALLLQQVQAMLAAVIHPASAS